MQGSVGLQKILYDSERKISALYLEDDTMIVSSTQGCRAPYVAIGCDRESVDVDAFATGIARKNERLLIPGSVGIDFKDQARSVAAVAGGAPQFRLGESRNCYQKKQKGKGKGAPEGHGVESYANHPGN